MKKEIAQQISKSHKGFREISKWPSLREQIDGKDSPGQRPAGRAGSSTCSVLFGFRSGTMIPIPLQSFIICFVPSFPCILLSVWYDVLIMKNKGYLFLIYGSVGHEFVSYINI